MNAAIANSLLKAPTQLYVGGEWRAATGGGTVVVENPATAAPLAEVADARVEDAIAALDAACEAQTSWAAVTPRERGEILRRAYDAMMADLDDLAMLITLEMGKPLAEARAEVTYGA